MRSESKQFTSEFVIPIILCALVFILMLEYLPSEYGLNKDNGVFLYIGREITNGKIPYIDVWDHKGPLIFYINALGYLLGKFTGVWVLECLLMCVSTYVGYAGLKLLLNPYYAAWGTIAWFFGYFPFLYGGNSVEEYSTPINFFCLLFIIIYLKNERKIYPLLIGITAGLNLLLRTNNIGMQLTAGTILIFSDLLKKNYTRSIRNAGLILIGIGLVIIPVALFFYSKGALPDLIYANFIFNYIYSGNLEFSKSATLLIFFFSLGWPLWFAFIGWFYIARDMVMNIKSIPSGIMAFLLLGFPIEILLDTLSGRPYFHYMLLLAPYLALLNAFFAYKLFNFLANSKRNLYKPPIIFLCVSAVVFSWITFNELKSRLIILADGNVKLTETSDVITYIRKNSTDTDYVLVWGQDISLNVLAERSSPTRFGYQSLFLNPGFVTLSIEEIFLDDLHRNMPRLIVDTGLLPIVMENGVNNEKQFEHVPVESIHTIMAFSEFLNKHYCHVRDIGNYKIYKLNN